MSVSPLSKYNVLRVSNQRQITMHCSLAAATGRPNE
jgi:hypothetical protein